MNKDYVLNEVSRLVDQMGPNWVMGALKVHDARTENVNQMSVSPVERRSIGISERDVDDIFTYHDNPEAVPHYVEVREGAKAFSKVLLRHVPGCPDLSAALRKLRECVMTANAGIALGGKY